MSNYRTEAVYKCTVCNARTRVPVNREGLDVLPRCNLTMNCLGKLRRIVSGVDLSESSDRVQQSIQSPDWVQRRLLYTHEQRLLDVTWTINHNLGSEPRVHVYGERVVSDSITFVPLSPKEITVTSPDQITVTFEYPTKGTAQCVVTSSQTLAKTQQTTLSMDRANEASVETIQVTSDVGEITVATLAMDKDITIDLEYGTLGAVNSIKISYVGVDDIPSTDTPWVGTSRVLVNGKRYAIRSFNVTKTSLAPAFFLSGRVKDGDFVRIIAINGVRIKPGECIILLGRPPHGIVDRIKNQYIDPTGISTTSPEMYYSKGTIHASMGIVRTTYPGILTL